MKTTKINIYDAPSCNVLYLSGPSVICSSADAEEVKVYRDENDVLGW